MHIGYRLLIFGAMIAAGFFVAANPEFNSLVSQLGALGYLGAFILGILFVSSITVGLAGVLIFDLGLQLNSFWVAIFASLGAALGDYLIVKFVSTHIHKHNLFGIKNLTRKMKKAGLGWVVPLLGAFLLMSPLPDEAAVTMLGVHKLNTKKFLVVVFTLNFISIGLLVGLSEVAESVFAK
mgnify:CR=1 FL=1